MKAYKGFDKDLKCRGFQYEIGKTYEEPKAELCKARFHACEMPLDVLKYYPSATSRYCVVDLHGVSDERADDSKVCAKEIKFGAEIGMPELVKAQIEYVKSHTTTEHTDLKAATAGDNGAATAGDNGAATAGEYGAATARGTASVGKNGMAAARGNGVKVRGGMGAVLVCVIENDEDFEIKEWKAAVVDGEKIKPDTWYTADKGEFKEVEEK